ncbi:MAG: nitrous oxide reductase accessory protein NosL [Oligoflexia bacterium]|nr:nitrous oxide reductase accessory protein NosL [Oligoflexia bacterium]
MNRVLVLAIISLVQWGCTDPQTAQPIVLGQDQCQLCRMAIVDGHYGGEIISAKGKVFKFDSIECLLNFARSSQTEIQSVYLVDFLRPGTLLKAEGAVLRRSPGQAGPMGAGLVAFASAKEALGLAEEETQPLFGWQAVLDGTAK